MLKNPYSTIMFGFYRVGMLCIELNMAVKKAL